MIFRVRAFYHRIESKIYLLNIYAPKVSQWMFLLLFPGVFLYSSAIELGIIPPFLGGGVGLFKALIFIVLFPAVVFTSRHLKGKPLIYFILFLGLLLYALFYLVIHYFFGPSLYQRPDVVMQWLILIVSWAAIFSIGYFWPKQLSSLSIAVLIVMLFIMFILVLLNPHPDPNTLLTSLGRYKSIMEDSSSNYFLSYQGYARSVSVTGLVVLAIIRHRLMFWIMSGIILITLFFIGSRSELLGVLLVFPILLITLFIEQPKVTVFISLFILMLLSAMMFINYDIHSIKRQKEIFNLTGSASFQKRVEFNLEALQAIKKNPIGGDFSGHAYSSEGMGHYAHNLLSSWRQLGLIGFLLYSTLMIWPAIGTYHMIIRDPNLLQVDVWRISGVISVFMLLLTLGAKSIFSSVLALSWGFFIAAIKHIEPTEKNY